LENRIYSSASSSESILNPRISRDELAVNVVKTRSNSVYLNPLPLIYSDQGTTSVHRHVCPVRGRPSRRPLANTGDQWFCGLRHPLRRTRHLGSEIAPAIAQVASQQQRRRCAHSALQHRPHYGEMNTEPAPLFNRQTQATVFQATRVEQLDRRKRNPITGHGRQQGTDYRPVSCAQMVP
jgi:hypothetical protein